jgi:sugar lactone lactonase YvrE
MRLGTGTKSILAVVGTAIALLALTVPAGAATLSAQTLNTHVRIVTTFPGGQTVFPESLALGPDGSLYASVTTWGTDVNTGQIVRITSDGKQKPFGPSINLGPTALLTGVVFDSSDRLFVAEADYGSNQSHVYLVQPGSVTAWVTLPVGTFPNGLAVRDGWIYAADSYGGAIWRAPLNHPTTASNPWLQDPLLAPTTTGGLGANGIAFRDSYLYISVSDPGSIVRVHVNQSGVPGPVQTVVTDQRLVTVDGVAFDARGQLWVTVNGNDTLPASLDRVSPSGSLTSVITAAPWMYYPTQPVISGSTVYVENGAFNGGTPSVVKLTFPGWH